jgi:protein-L-isoaspartate(D-aspartate) O-methyltransferase
VFARFLLTLLLILPVSALQPANGADDFAALRRQMVEDIAELARQTSRETGKNAVDKRVIDAMATVPRHRFVPPDQERAAYRNRPLPIGYGQTISQPYIVAVMTDLMNVKPGDTVLEIGTGSGYQAAILAELVRDVYTIEVIEALARQAAERLQQLGYVNVRTRTGDGYYGWEEHAPYDSIIVTAAASHVPPPLMRQLKPGGRMVIPLGAPFLPQQLMLIEKKADGTFLTRQILPVQFVPLTGGH